MRRSCCSGARSTQPGPHPPQEPLRGYNEVIVGRCYLACYPTVPLGWMKPVHRTQPHGGTTLTTERTRPPKRRIQAIHVHMVCFEWFKSQVQTGRGGTLVHGHPFLCPYFLSTNYKSVAVYSTGDRASEQPGRLRCGGPRVVAPGPSKKGQAPQVARLATNVSSPHHNPSSQSLNFPEQSLNLTIPSP